LEKPGRDPRPEFKTAAFKEGVEKISDLQPGMVLEGAVTNVVDFGAFVDVGVHQDGLVHVSVLADKFVKDPREVVRPGDIVKVKVVEVDLERKRIALSMRMDDGAARAKPRGDERRPKGKPQQKKGSPKGRGPRPPQGPKGGGKPSPRPDSGGGALAAAFAEAMKKKG
jgi:uncharacterized protein